MKKLVQRRLNATTAGRWLLIVDNADDMELVHGSERRRACCSISSEADRPDSVHDSQLRGCSVARGRFRSREAMTIPKVG